MDAHGPSLANTQRNKNISSVFIKLRNVPDFYGNYALIYDNVAAKRVLKAGSIETMAIDNSLANKITNNKISGYLLNKKAIT